MRVILKFLRQLSNSQWTANTRYVENNSTEINNVIHIFVILVILYINISKYKLMLSDGLISTNTLLLISSHYWFLIFVKVNLRDFVEYLYFVLYFLNGIRRIHFLWWMTGDLSCILYIYHLHSVAVSNSLLT